MYMHTLMCVLCACDFTGRVHVCVRASMCVVRLCVFNRLRKGERVRERERDYMSECVKVCVSEI